MVEDCRLQLLVTASLCAGPLETWVREAIRGGVDLIQIREKDCDTEERLARARPAIEAAADAGVPVLINDDVEAAVRASVAGVHVGQDDVPVAEARTRLGEGRWIGLSTHSVAELRAAHGTGATHLGLGACFATGTRPDSAVLDAAELDTALSAATLPVFAIGGITPERVAGLRSRGVTRIAVSSCVLRSSRPRDVAARLRDALS